MIRDNIREQLRKKGMSQIDLAKKLGISPETLSRTINGNPTLKSLTDIANAIEIEVATLFSSINVNGFIEANGKTYKVNSVPDLLDVLEKLLEIDEVREKLTDMRLLDFKNRLEFKIESLGIEDTLRKKGVLIE